MAGRAESLRAFAEQFRTLSVDFSLPTEKRLALATTLLHQAIANGAFNGPEWLILRSLVEVGGQDDARLAGSFRDLVDWLASHGDKFEIMSGFDWPRGDEILLMNPLAATFWHLAVVLERFAELEGMQDSPPDEARAFAAAEKVLTDLCNELGLIELLIGQKPLARDALWKRFGRLAQIVLAADKTLDLTLMQRIEHPADVTVCKFTEKTYCEAVYHFSNHVLTLACHAADIYLSSNETDVAVIMRDAAKKSQSPHQWDEGRWGLVSRTLEGFDADAVSKRVASELRKAAKKTTSTTNPPGTVRKRNEKPFVELEVDLARQRATLRTAKGEEPIDLPSEGVARWLKVLAEHPDEWIRPDAYETHGGVDLQGLRPRDKLRTLDTNCPQLGRLIATSKHDGMRFEPAWALKSGRAPRCATNR